MAGLSAAWRLSEPGWRDRFESITVYQRGWRLGGKGASSRGDNGRIEEHGLHIWLGSYENAFALLRECYAELDRATTDPGRPDPDVGPGIDPGRQSRRWRTDGATVGWHGWARSPATTSCPVIPSVTGREMTVVDVRPAGSAVAAGLRRLGARRDAEPAWHCPTLGRSCLRRPPTAALGAARRARRAAGTLTDPESPRTQSRTCSADALDGRPHGARLRDTGPITSGSGYCCRW